MSSKTYQVWASEKVWYLVDIEAESESEAVEKAEQITDWGHPIDGDNFIIEYAELA